MQLNTALVRLGEGYDLALVANSHAPDDEVNLSIAAFDSRGLAAAAQAGARFAEGSRNRQRHVVAMGLCYSHGSDRVGRSDRLSD
jgi:hypothetical protein